MKKTNQSFLFLIMGPGLLLASLLILLIRVGPLCGHPVWILGVFASTLLSVSIIYISLQDLKKKEREKEIEHSELKTALSNIRSILDETQAIYREKVEKLEVVCHEKGEENILLQTGYEALQESLKKQKNLTGDFQTSLEDALEELCHLRQEIFLQEKRKDFIPGDLIHKHQQLREQFQEKLEMLEGTKRKLFSVEGELFYLQKEQENHRFEESADLKEVLALVQEKEEREKEIMALEELVSSLIEEKKKTSASKSKKKLEEMLEFNFSSTELGSQPPQG